MIILIDEFDYIFTSSVIKNQKKNTSLDPDQILE